MKDLFQLDMNLPAVGWALGSDELASTLLVCGLGSRVGCRESIGGDLYTFWKSGW